MRNRPNGADLRTGTSAAERGSVTPGALFVGHDAPLIKSGWLLGAGHLLQAGDSLGHRRVRREQLPHHIARPERVGDHQM
jgi:hypothetical protein